MAKSNNINQQPCSALLLTSPPQFLTASSATELTQIMQSAHNWQGGGMSTTQAGSSLGETGSTVSRGRGGTRGGSKAQHAKAGQLGGLATGKRLGRPRKSANTETSGAIS